MPAKKTDEDTPPITGIGNNSEEELKRLDARLDDLEEQKADILGDIKDVWSKVKASGFNVKVVRQVRKLRAMDKAARDEQFALVNLYANALGIGDLV